MRGGHIHNKVLLPPVITHCRALGATIFLEHPVKVGTRRGAVDALVKFYGHRLVIEAGTSCRRICWEIEKACALKADGLLIVVPTLAIAVACQGEIKRRLPLADCSGVAIYALTLPKAHQWLSQYFLLISASIEASASRIIKVPDQNLPSSLNDSL